MARRGQNEGSYRKRADGLWEGRISLGYDSEGRRLSKSVYGRTISEVRERVITAREDARSERPGSRASKTLALGTFLEQWLADVVKPSKAASSFLRYGDLARKHIVPMIGRTRLASLTPMQLQTFYRKLPSPEAAKFHFHIYRIVIQNLLIAGVLVALGYLFNKALEH